MAVSILILTLQKISEIQVFQEIKTKFTWIPKDYIFNCVIPKKNKLHDV